MELFSIRIQRTFQLVSTIEEQIPCDYNFYATLVHPEKENIMLSIIIHQDYDTLIDNNIYPSIAIKVIEHEFSEIGNCMYRKTKYQLRHVFYQ